MKGRNKEAIDAYSSAISINSSPELLIKRSASYLRNKEIEKSLQDSSAALRMNVRFSIFRILMI